MVNNKSKNQLNEDRLEENYNLWMNNKITNAQYFKEISRIKDAI